MRRKLDIEVKAGIFVFLGLAVMMLTILLMGGGRSLFESYYRIHMEVADAGGLSKGATVKSGGLTVGRVEAISFTENYAGVKITILIEKGFQQRIREDSLVRFQTQGVLGDKYLEITGGSPEAAALDDGGQIQAEASKDLAGMLADGGNAVELLKENLANLKVITSSMAENNQMSNIMRDLQTTSANLKEVTQTLKSSNLTGEMAATMKNFRVVSERMKNGEGTIGALFSDASLYEDLKGLIGGANRSNVLRFFVRQAVKSSDNAAAEKQEEKKKEAPKGKEPASQRP
jgi:phospholipid/cholesterol/gamma-HCH transport system substrate-binding protein